MNDMYIYRECKSGAGKCKIEIKRENVNTERGGVVKGINNYYFSNYNDFFLLFSVLYPFKSNYLFIY